MYMKLISMTSFVLYLVRKMESKEESYLKIFNYAKFLKQPLKLDMFIGENALIEGWEITQVNGYDILYRNADFLFVSNLDDSTIEYLTKYNLTLTPYAIKQLGL